MSKKSPNRPKSHREFRRAFEKGLAQRARVRRMSASSGEPIIRAAKYVMKAEESLHARTPWTLRSREDCLAELKKVGTGRLNMLVKLCQACHTLEAETADQTPSLRSLPGTSPETRRAVSTKH